MISLILGLALIGFLLWLITTYIPMDVRIKQLIVVIVVVCIVLYLLSAFGFTDYPLPRLRR